MNPWTLLVSIIMIARLAGAAIAAILAALLIVMAIALDHKAGIVSALSFFATGVLTYVAYRLSRPLRPWERAGS